MMTAQSSDKGQLLMSSKKFRIPAAIIGLALLADTIAVPTLAKQPGGHQVFKPLLIAQTSSGTQSSTSPKVEVRLRAFIPSGAVSLLPNYLQNPFLCNIGIDTILAPIGGLAAGPIVCSLGLGLYGGDNRSFSYSAGTHRAFQSAIINVGGTPPISSKLGFCTTTKYDASEGNTVSGKPWWWWSIKSNERPIASKRLSLNNSNNTIGLVRINSNQVKVTLHLDSGNPLLGYLAPPIQSDINVYIQEVNGKQQYRAEGNHDLFPAYELYINGSRVYQYDPTSSSIGPAGLLLGLINLPFTKTSVNINWKDVPNSNQPTYPNDPNCPLAAG